MLLVFWVFEFKSLGEAGVNAEKGGKTRKTCGKQIAKYSEVKAKYSKYSKVKNAENKKRERKKERKKEK